MTNTISPFVTVIMPIRNESEFIERSLGAVLQQDYAHKNLEIVIADGMSDDDTRDKIYSLADQSSIPIKIIDNPKRIVPTGMNLALQKVKGDIIVRVDGHCEIALDYISQCVQKLQENNIAGVGGPIETISETKVGEAIALAMSSTFGVGNSAFRTIKEQELFVDTIAFPAYWRHFINEAGLLDEEMVRNQDDEYNYRIRSLGYKLLLSPDIKSRYYSRTSLSKLWKQYYQYGYYKVRVLQKHPRQMRLRQFVPSIFAIVHILGMLGSIFFWQIGLLWFFVICLYLVANLVASILLSSKTTWQNIVYLPIIFTILHFSYGIGFLYGMFKFRNRWTGNT